MLRPRPFAGFLAASALLAQSAKLPPPQVANARYGPHERNVLDLWQAPTPGPAPLVIFIHGGGYVAGSKANLSPTLLSTHLAEGISVAAINYRYVTTHPFPAPMLDAARAVQFLRHHARQWKIDPRFIGGAGGSAGASIALWLGFHDDLANIDSADPVARQSSKLQAMAVHGAQTSNDPRIIGKLIGEPAARHPSGKLFYRMLGDRWDSPEAGRLFDEASPVYHVSAGDPPALLIYNEPDRDIPPDAKPGAGIHSPRFGRLLVERCAHVGVPCESKQRASYPDRNAENRDVASFFARHLKRNRTLPPPDLANVAYGPHGRNVFDFWSAKAGPAAPLVLFIHGGGFVGGDKSGLDPGLLQRLRDAGFAVASLNYRYSTQAPYPAPMYDCVRALQFLRNKAPRFRIDPGRIASTGGSAGAAITLWIGLRDDLSDIHSSDPVARHTTRLKAMAVLGGQTFLDPRLIAKQISEVTARHPALPLLFGIPPAELSDDAHAALFDHASAARHVTRDDPPAYLFYNESRDPVKASDKPGAGIHKIEFGAYLKERMDKVGVECVVRHGDEFNGPGNPREKAFDEIVAFLSRHLR